MLKNSVNMAACPSCRVEIVHSLVQLRVEFKAEICENLIKFKFNPSWELRVISDKMTPSAGFELEIDGSRRFICRMLIGVRAGDSLIEGLFLGDHKTREMMDERPF